MMVIAIGLSSYNIALYHLINHAFKIKNKYFCLVNLFSNLINLVNHKRQYSSSCTQLSNILVTKKGNKFLEWFRGFTDGEGSFMILGNYVFVFQIKLHIDDLNTLKFIRDSLGIGKVKTSNNTCTFIVNKEKDIALIIEIFSKYNLNTVKHLDFLSFKEAYLLYFTRITKSIDVELNLKISNIKNTMNSRITDFNLNNHNINLSLNWILGFIEAEGSFSVSKNFKLFFSLAQSSVNLELMKKISNYFEILVSEDFVNYRVNSNIVSLSCTTYNNLKWKDSLNLIITNKDYILKYFIPVFDNLDWHTKKLLDYNDWKIIGEIRELGFQYTEEGVDLIKLIQGQMNNNRLSTNLNKNIIYRKVLDNKIEDLLKKPSNFEQTKDGNILIKSLGRVYHSGNNISINIIDEKGLVLNNFKSIAKCAEFLGIYASNARVKLNKNKGVLYKGKLIFIKKLQ